MLGRKGLFRRQLKEQKVESKGVVSYSFATLTAEDLLMQFRILVVFLTVLGLAIVGSAQTARPDTEPSKGYMIGPGDEITGKVLGEEQFDFVTTVDENGKLEVPFFETPINAKCLTERELRI